MTSQHFWPTGRYDFRVKKLLARGALVLVLVGGLGLAAAGAASAGGTSHGPVSERTYRVELASYRAARRAIETTFRTAVATAQSNYRQAIAAATTSAERSAAQQTLNAAIVQAAEVRSASLTALGAAPTPPSL